MLCVFVGACSGSDNVITSPTTQYNKLVCVDGVLYYANNDYALAPAYFPDGHGGFILRTCK